MKRFLSLFLAILFFTSCTEQQQGTPKQVDNPFYDKAYDLSENNQQDSAYRYFDKAKEMFLQQKDSLGVAKCLMHMAYISTAKGDYFGGQELSLTAIAYLNELKQDHHPFIVANLDNLAEASNNLKKYTIAINFYKKAITFVKDAPTLLKLKNSIATTYRRNKDYQNALDIYNDVLRQKNTPTEYAKVLSNYAYTKWLQNPNYNAAPHLLKALNLRIKHNDLWGQNASFSHLSDYYAEKNPDSSFYFANKMFTVAKLLSSADDKRQALKKLIRLSPAPSKLAYFEDYQKISDSIQVARDADKNQFALIRYETEKSKADNLVLQKDNTDKKYQIIKGQILLYSSLFVLAAGTIITIIWYKKRKLKIALETQNAIRESRLKTSKKVHDVVANGLYRVMTEIENTAGLDKEEMLDRLDQMYQKSRDISYEVEETKPIVHNFSLKITALLQAFTAPATKVTIRGNTNELWTKVNDPTKLEIEHVLQELMVNMKKHSHATVVEVLFEQKNKRIYISYIDNGVGMPEQVQYKNGLRNTGNRIEHIGGEITFDTKLEKGLKILISFPVV